MSDFLSAADILEREVNRLKGLADIYPRLREIGSLEQAAADAKRNLGELRQEEAVIYAAIREAQHKLEAETAKKAAVLDNATRVAADLTEQARVQATEVAVKAQVGAKAVAAKAQADAKEVTDAAMKRKADIDALMQQNRAAVVKLEGEIADKQAALASVEDKLAKAKAAAKKMLES